MSLLDLKKTCWGIELRKAQKNNTENRGNYVKFHLPSTQHWDIKEWSYAGWNWIFQFVGKIVQIFFPIFTQALPQETHPYGKHIGNIYNNFLYANKFKLIEFDI